MARGRRPGAAQLVEALDGSAQAKRRLQVLLETFSGKRNVPQACAALGIGQAMFYKLRSRWLQQALESLEPRAPGRPRKPQVPEVERAEELALRVKHLERELKAAQVREQLAIALPHVVSGGTTGGKKNARRR